jgi:DHA1 family multidrug resistance protein-like MFS transporter
MKDRKSFALVFFALFLMMLGNGIIIPVFPYYVKNMGASAFQLGLLLTVYSLCQFIFAPIWGRYSDRVGRKPLLLLGIAGYAVSFILYGLAHSLWVLFAARIAGGILSAAVMPTAMAYIGDVTTKEQRGSSMGFMGASMGLGMVMGPALGGIFSGISFTFPFFFAAGLAIVNDLTIFLFLKESLPPEKRTQQQEKAAVESGLSSLLGELRTPLFQFFIMIFLASVAHSMNEATYALFMQAKINMGAKEAGWAFMVAGIVMVILQGLLVGRMINSLGEKKTIVIGLCSMAAGLVLLLHSYNILTAIIFLAVFCCGMGLIRPATSSAVSKGAVNQGRSLGAMQGFDSLGRVVGPALGGFLLDVNLFYAYLAAAAIALVAVICFKGYDYLWGREVGC